ncbi:cyclic nucleotide-binding domain-containing protein [Lachnoclostridium sp.]|uniref:cyclic nucleotide-binding domain-containing protein n=1 Tax=Lachnoclostridium sp. TaxID=2028282 RepID=UPI002899334C|nr:cyclic nucleotide-binding domain-containing protein [Lachnoclostridium sp.]
MQSSPLKKEHLNKLEGYGINNMALDACLCLRFEAGETILQEGMPIIYLMFVVTGKVKICSTAKNGKDLVLCYYISDGIIGDLELMTNTYDATAGIIAITDFECIALPFQKYAIDLKNNLAFLKRLGSELSMKLLRISKNYVVTTLYTGEERLCSYILQASHNGIFNDILTDVSCSIGMSYRHMFRLLNQLCTDGVLDKRDNGYIIVDREELLRRAPGAYV